MVKRLDELGIIELFVEQLGQPSPPASPIGDDVAVLPVGRGFLVAKTDMLVAKTDVPRGMSLRQAARKSVVMCVSDFAAKGVKPRYALLSLGIPRSMDRRGVLDLAKGFRDAKRKYSVEIAGGDTNECDDLVIDCCMLGFAEKVVPRSGAKIGDVVVSSGLFGLQPSGVRILTENAWAQPAFRKRAVRSVFEPNARLGLGLALAEAGLLNSSIDSSDGLAISLHEIAEKSMVSIEVQRVPYAPGVREFAETHGLPIRDLLFYGGEEYEIVGTMAEENFREAQKVAGGLGVSLAIVGRVVEGEPGVTLNEDGEKSRIERKGWIHLA